MDYNKYFEILKEQSKFSYKEYQEALEVFRYLNKPINDDFYHPLAIATDNITFKIIHKEENGWQVVMANAIFALGPSPKIKIVDRCKTAARK